MDKSPSRADRLLNPEALQRIPLLAGLQHSELETLAAQMYLKRYAKGEFVLMKGSASDALMFLLSGSLQVVDYTEDGKEIGLNLFAAGSFFGELALIDGLPRSASIVALEDSAVAFLPRQPALALIYGKPVVAEQMMKHFARTIRRLTAWRGLLAIPNAQQRLFALLCQMKQPLRDGREAIPRLPTQRQIAIMINTSRETVSRAIAILERQGVVEKRQPHILIIKHPRVLEQLAASEPQTERSAASLTSPESNTPARRR